MAAATQFYRLASKRVDCEEEVGGRDAACCAPGRITDECVGEEGSAN